MRRVVRKPGFWVILIVVSFVLNLLAVWVTLHKHLRLPSSSSLFLTPSLTGRHVSDQVPESVLWHRMLQETPDYCKEAGGTNTSMTSTTTATRLPTFGFHQDVRRYLNNDSSIPTTKTCFLQSSTSCHVAKYSVVVLSEGTNLRRLSLNLMTFLSYPSVLDITLVLALDTATLSKDTKYGQRLLEWNRLRTIKLLLTLETKESLWSVLANKIQPRSEAVVWIQGDGPKDWNGTVLKHNLRSWRETSRLLLATRNVVGSSSCPFPQWHQMMMHRNMLCYLGHPVVSPLREYTEARTTDSWDITQSAISILWNHIGDGHVVVGMENDGTASKQARRYDVREKATESMLDYFGCHCAWKPTIQWSSINATCWRKVLST